ncbi:tryptophan--tRNA ligase [Sansalvadorimonas verongulae]|uniref:tryptophan--tRNA ligase n=1 Tax=Sansalvadorimonas verongulae TaxID=2172824 RepID=UPI0012BC4E56|nr:tryptophan--tRNA ligase [Sansalvadorimonas verongulae]MTI13000.1 tryptophan--tRNA ligase [Sansalvadorimonas verongulae]
MNAADPQSRVLSGMRPTGQLHLGHYHGVLKNWLTLQHEYECFFFVADWHALTTHYDDPALIQEHALEMVIDWLAAGINPGQATLFVQSRVPEHAELHLLLSMMTPLSWLERVPTYKDQLERLKERDLSTYGFLGYPLLQSADILAYRAGLVPVGSDQEAHLEITREIARRFNHIYGREPGFETKAEQAISKMGRKSARLYRNLRRGFQETGDLDALETARALLREQQNITLGDQERLQGYLEGTGKVILPEPSALLTEQAKMLGLDGQKMSKSYGNAIALRDDTDTIVGKIRRMQTDPARMRRTDPGEPEKCPVWNFHKIYSDETLQEWVCNGCRSASIGCLECKAPVIETIDEEIAPIRLRAAELQANPDEVSNILAEGSERAGDEAGETLRDVREAMGLGWR